MPGGERPIRKEPFKSLAAKALRPSRSTWAELLKRVIEIDALTCLHCGGKRIALLTQGAVVRRILAHLGLPTAAPTLSPARSPPELEFKGQPPLAPSPSEPARTVPAWVFDATANESGVEQPARTAAAQHCGPISPT